MNVPNHEKKPFKDMTPEERSAIVEALLCDEVEIFAGSGWISKKEKVIIFESTYRTKQRKLVIPWEHIHPDIRNAVLTEVDTVLLSDKPFTFVKGRWLIDSTVYNLFPCIVDTEGVYWKDSQVERPE